MPVKPGIFSACCLLMLVCGCESKSGDNQNSAAVSAPQVESTASPNAATTSPPANQQPAASLVSSAGSVDVCALIDKADIESVQGGQVQSLTPSAQMNGALAISQCYYTVMSTDGSKNFSVHLQVIQADPKSGSPNAVKDYWERSFGREAKGDDEDKESGKPLPVRGIGEEAFWTGNAKAGAVYALKKGKMVRLSLGGPDDVKTKIGKSKTLIAGLLKRLS